MKQVYTYYMKQTAYFFIISALFWACNENKTGSKVSQKKDTIRVKNDIVEKDTIPVKYPVLDSSKTYYKDFDFSRMEGKNPITKKDTLFPCLEIVKDEDKITIISHRFAPKWGHRTLKYEFLKEHDYYKCIVIYTDKWVYRYTDPMYLEKYGKNKISELREFYFFKTYFLKYEITINPTQRDKGLQIVSISKYTGREIKTMVYFEGTNTTKTDPYFNFDDQYERRSGRKFKEEIVFDKNCYYMIRNSYDNFKLEQKKDRRPTCYPPGGEFGRSDEFSYFYEIFR